jgi:hypothetical protein
MSHPDRSCAVPAYLLPPSLVRSDAKLNQASLYPLVISVNDGQPRTRAREDPKSSSPSCLGCFRTERAHRTLIGPHRSLTPIRQATGAVGRSAPIDCEDSALAARPWPERHCVRATELLRNGVVLRAGWSWQVSIRLEVGSTGDSIFDPAFGGTTVDRAAAVRVGWIGP